MPGIIGKNSIGGSSAVMPGNSRAIMSVGLLYTAVAGDIVDQFFFHGWDSFVPGASVDVAVYDTAAGVPVNRIGSVTNIPVTASAFQWWPSAAALGIALAAGTVYCVALVQNVGCRYSYDTVSGCCSNDPAGALPAVWSHAAFNNFEFSTYANVIGSAPPVIPVGGSSADEFDLLGIG